MAPLVRLLALFSILAPVLASPHVSRHVYNHAHRAIAHPAVHVDSPPLPVPRRKRSLNKRCIPRPDNTTTPSTTPLVPVNVVPTPSIPASSPPSPAETTPSTSSSPTPQVPLTTSSPTPSPTLTPSPTTTTPAPTQTYTNGEPSYLIGVQSGQGTYYDTGLGACGITNTGTDDIVAVSYSLFDTFPGYNRVNPNTNPVCGNRITAYYENYSVNVTVVDRCTGCDMTSLDFSSSAFNQLTNGNSGLGRIDITWEWISLT